MIKVRMKKSAGALLMVISIIMCSCSGWNHPEAVNGVLDLRDTPYDKEKLYSLNGEWEFYFNRLLPPNEENLFNKENLTAYINIPCSWNTIDIEKKLPSKGFATYRLRIKLPADLRNLGLKIPSINTAFELYINGTLYTSVGNVSTVPREGKPQYKPQILLYHSTMPEVELVFHVSNYHHQRAGINRSIILGEFETVIRMRENNKARELFFSGSIFIILIYNLWIFIWRKKEKAMLFFSILSFFMLIRIFFHGENIILELIPVINWIFHYRIELISTFLLPLFFSLFISYLFPGESSMRFCFIFNIIGIICSLFLLVAPTSLFSFAFDIYQFIFLFHMIYFYIVLIRGILKKRSGAIPLLIGFSFFNYSVINDILYAQLIIQSGYIVPLGFFIFSIFEFSIHINFVRAKDLLVSSENKIMALLNALPDPMVYFTHQGVIMDYKTKEENMLIEGTKDMRGKNLYEMIPDDLTSLFKAVISNNALNNTPTVFEYTFNQSIPVRYFKIRLMKGTENTYLAIIQDITESKITEQKLFQAEKLAAMGTMVAGVAHEINNPNNSILLMADNFKDDFAALFEEIEDNFDPGELRINGELFSHFANQSINDLNRLKRNALRIKQIVKDLKDFSAKQHEENQEDLDLNKVMECAAQLLQNTIKNSTNHFTLVKGKIPLIKANFQRLEQVFINLFQNACDALEDKDKKITATTSCPGKTEIIIEIKDEGKGISPETQNKIFDPFFTTKQNSGGLGLGLSITRKIIESHNGSIEYNSIPGKGTSVIIRLPAKNN